MKLCSDAFPVLLWGLLLIWTFSRLEGWLEMDRWACHMSHGFQMGLYPSNHYQFASCLSPCNILGALDYRASRKHRLKIGKTACNTDVVKQTLVSNALSECEISAIPSKTQPHNVLHIKMQKEVVIWTYIYFFSIKQYNLVRGNPSPTLHRSPWLWPEQHYWNNLTRITLQLTPLGTPVQCYLVIIPTL